MTFALTDRLLFSMLLLLLLPLAQAQEISASFMEGGRVVYDAQPVERDYRLALSSLRKINNQWRISNEEKLHGRVQRKTIELDVATTFAEARLKLRQVAAGLQGATVSFTCEGLDCGSSNGWANQVFGIKVLFGIDLYQYYTVLRFEQGEQTVHAVYYLVQRGSGRVYLQEDLIVSTAGSSHVTVLTEDILKQQLLSRGYWTVTGNGDASRKMDTAEAAIIASLMTKNKHWRLAIVGHNYQALPLDEQKQRSLIYAELIRQQLQDAGVKPERLATFGLGGLAPAGRVGGGSDGGLARGTAGGIDGGKVGYSRVELVLQTQ
jgi:Domain of unknown function (DUF4892)